jgi:hypothetical protein
MNVLEYHILQGKLALHRHTVTNLRNIGKYQRIDTAGHHSMSRLHFTRLFVYHLQYGDVRFEKGKTGAIGQ